MVFMKLPSSSVVAERHRRGPGRRRQAPRLRGRARRRARRGRTASPATRSPTTSPPATSRAARRSGRAPRASTPPAPGAPGSRPPTRSPTPRRCASAHSVNGEVRQDSSTSDLVFGPQALVDCIAQTCTLEPGDIILTGTPEGVGQSMDPPQFLATGDVVRLEVEGLGAIEHTIAIAVSSGAGPSTSRWRTADGTSGPTPTQPPWTSDRDRRADVSARGSRGRSGRTRRPDRA